MWWHALLAVWWRTGWRRTSNQTISAVPGANVLELREYLLLSSFVSPLILLLCCLNLICILSCSSNFLFSVPQKFVSSIHPSSPPVSCPWIMNSLLFCPFSLRRVWPGRCLVVAGLLWSQKYIITSLRLVNPSSTCLNLTHITGAKPGAHLIWGYSILLMLEQICYRCDLWVWRIFPNVDVTLSRRH